MGKVMGRGDYAAAPPVTKEWEIEGLGTVKIRALSAFERKLYHKNLFERREASKEKGSNDSIAELDDWKVEVCARHIVDESNKLIYDVNKPEDLSELAVVGASFLDEIFEESRILSGMIKGDKKDSPLASKSDSTSA